jgi:glycogen debranching enzyme
MLRGMSGSNPARRSNGKIPSEQAQVFNSGHTLDGETEEGTMVPKGTYRFYSLILCGCLLRTLAPGMALGAEAGYDSRLVTETPLTLRAEATARRFVAAHGHRGMMVGYAAESLEGWVYPFRIFHDYQLSFRTEGASNSIPGPALVRDVLVNPESVTRIYSGRNFTVKETIFVPLDVPGLTVLYQVESQVPLHLALSFRPDLDLMWPGSIGGQSYGWDSSRHAFLLQVSSGKYSALVGSPVARNHSALPDYTQPWILDRVLSLELDIPARTSERYYPLVISCGMPGYDDATRTYDSLLKKIPELYDEAVRHYQQLQSNHLQVETPNPEVNLAYAWAQVALDQAYVCNPRLGCGLVAGYGPSRDTRRPQFAWFFGGDALIQSFALEAAGDHDLARDAFRFIQKHQEKETGEIFHELSQSAGWIDWFKDYPYAYRHTDASAMYLVAFRNLYRASGDGDFLRSSWDSLRAAYQYLVSRVDPQDGLVTVPGGGWGGDETISEQIREDIYLEAVWVSAADSMRELAGLMGDSPLARDAQTRAQRARASVASKFWNPQRGFYSYGVNGRSQLLQQEMSQVDWGVWLGVFDDDKAEQVLDGMARARWQADWGVRSIPQDDPLYIGDSYGHGSVWPLGTGVQSLAFYRHHRTFGAYQLWHTLVEQTFLNSLGHVPEVLSGDFYRELDVCVPEQIWSSGMTITALVRGVLGLEPNAPEAKLAWSPHLPKDWPSVKLRNLRVGGSTLSLDMKQTDASVILHLENSGLPISLDFSPEIPLGAKKPRATLNGSMLPVALEPHGQDLHCRVRFSAEKIADIVITFEPGLRIWLPQPALRIGDKSRGLRILSSELNGRSYRAEVEGVPEACSQIHLSTPWRVAKVTGGKVNSHAGDQWALIVSPKPESCGPAGAYQRWPLQVDFAP